VHWEARDHILNGESANFVRLDFMSAHIELAHEVGDTSPATKESHVRLDEDFVTAINFAYQVAALTQRLRIQNDCAHIHLSPTFGKQTVEENRFERNSAREKTLVVAKQAEIWDDGRTTCLRLVSI
jgi:hypothetical protein